MSSLPERFNSNDGHAFLREVTQNLLPYHPHDTSIEALAGIVDGNDVLVRR